MANGLNEAFVPSACSHAVMAFTFSDVIGMFSLVRKSRAHWTESTPALFNEPELVGTLPEVAVVLCADARASANDPVLEVESAPTEVGSEAVAVGSEAPSTPPGVVVPSPNWLWISWMRACTAAIPSIPPHRPPAPAVKGTPKPCHQMAGKLTP